MVGTERARQAVAERLPIPIEIGANIIQVEAAARVLFLNPDGWERSF